MCKWWDQVAPRDQDQVLSGTLRRLTRVLPGVTDRQLFPISSTEVRHRLLVKWGAEGAGVTLL